MIEYMNKCTKICINKIKENKIKVLMINNSKIQIKIVFQKQKKNGK